MRACDNPFRTDRVLQVRYRLRDTTWPELLARLGRMNLRAAIVGPHGSGKTTLLEDLDEKLRRQGHFTRFIRLSEENRRIDPALWSDLKRDRAGNDIILFDGAEQLNVIAWHWFRWRARQARGLIITTHRPSRLLTLIECRTDAHLLAELMAQLLGTDAASVQSEADMLFVRHHGNLRDALRECYDVAARSGSGSENIQRPSSSERISDSGECRFACVR